MQLPLAGKHHATIMGAYASTMMHPDKVKEQLYEDLESFLINVLKEDKLRNLGDFKARQEEFIPQKFKDASIVHLYEAIKEFKDRENQTTVTEFIFLGFSNHPDLQGLFFLLFLVIYLITILGNTLILAAIRVNPILHTPMYYFLSNLSFLDICYTSTTLPIILVNFFREKKTISYEGCLSQVFFLVTFAGCECVLLAVMAYDRFVAICHPLRYPVLMSNRVCAYLAVGTWLYSFLNSLMHTVLMATLTLCGPNQISHFLCDIPLLLKLSCSDTSANEVALYLSSATVGLSPCLFTAMSYMLIISAILKIQSAQGRKKAFSTCASHLTVVVIYYGTINFNYDRPSSGYSLDVDILASVLFCIVTPMLNPIIYSLRNKEVKNTLRKLFERYMLPSGSSV
ncbi:olfactory receptor 5V1-like [Trichosurus vulpecula]|uniref:olfactory receptor 5V1-like n=1 Tax=Trichosurus vulpecula TaxID=9337 RepID=UPI00186B14AD|nr:olfactory receptor 5V1-like [Trichosurus vulpecula]